MNSPPITESASSASHEKDLWRRFGRERDQRAREELITIYLPVARRMAKRYAGVAEPYEDLAQVASLGLLNAIDRYDPARGTPFVGFAKPTIMGELKRYFRDKVWAIRVPRVLHDRLAAIDAATEDLSEELSRSPSVKELAEYLQIDIADVLEALEAKENRRPLGLDVHRRGEDEDGPTASEWAGCVDPGYDLVEDRLAIASVIPGLDEREREVLRLRLVEDLPQSRIAERIGCSQMQISRLLRSTLERMREAAEAEGPPPDEPSDDRERRRGRGRGAICAARGASAAGALCGGDEGGPSVTTSPVRAARPGYPGPGSRRGAKASADTRGVEERAGRGSRGAR